MPEHRLGIYARFNTWVRRLCLAAILVVCALLIGRQVIGRKVDDEIRSEIASRFARHYPEHVVRVRDARLLEGRGIEIHGVSISQRSSGKKLVEIDDIFATCAIKLEDLLTSQSPRAEQLTIRGLKVWAKQQADGSWNVQQLWPLPSFGNGHPPVLLRDGMVELSLNDGGRPSAWNLRKIQLSVLTEPGRRLPDPGAPPAAVIEPGNPLTQRPLPAAPQPALLVQGTLEGDHFQSVDLKAHFHPQNRAWNATGELKGLQLSPQLLATLPATWQAKLGPAAAVRGQLKLGFRVASPPTAHQPIQFTVTGALTEGEIVDARLPYRLHDVAGQFFCDNQRLSITELTARSGRSSWRLSLDRAGLEAGRPLSLRVQANQLVLDGSIVECLPADAKVLWRKYFPAGLVNADVRLVFDGERWRPEFDVECLDVAFEYYKFPYRVEGTHGTVRLQGNRLQLQLATLANGQAVHVQGEFENPGEQHTGWLEVSCDGPIPIDEKLLSAIVDPPQAQPIVRALHPGGMLTFNGRFVRRTPGGPLERKCTLDVKHGTLQYDKFPYPLNSIQGTMDWDNTGWTFRHLSGRNHSGYIECQGTWKTSGPTAGQLVLNMTGAEVPLEDALRDALSPGAKRLWSDLRPRGSVDSLKVDLRYHTASAQLDLDVWAQKLRGPGDEGYKISLQPVWFPYRLEDVVGTVHYRNGQVTLQNISAVHNDTEISVEGGCDFDRSGDWTIRLNKLIADRLLFDRDFLTALPPSLGKAITKLNLQGAVNVQGSLALGGVARTEGRPAARWDFLVDVENGGLRSGLPVEHIHGDVRLFGESDQDSFYSRGELNLDSVVYKDVQLTQVRGPLWIDANRLVFGAEAERGRKDQPPRPLTANVFGGILSADASLEFDGDLPFRVQARLERGDLTQIARELAWKNQNIGGKANALLNLTGTPQGPHSWRGSGFVRLFEADIYEVPVMLGLLKILSVRRPDTTAFTSSDIDYHIQGEDVYLDRINFNGDVISLKGRGELNLDRQIALTFYTLVGHGELRPAVLRAILRTASKQMLLIRVTGSLDEPQMTREPLPMLKETLDQIFPELANRPLPTRLPPTTATEPVRRNGHTPTR